MTLTAVLHRWLGNASGGADGAAALAASPAAPPRCRDSATAVRWRRDAKKTKKMVLSITNKLQKRAGARASDIENTVASAILDIQNNADPATKEQLIRTG